MADPRPATPTPAQPEVPAAARLHIWQVQAVRDALWVGAIISLFWLGYAMRSVTVPLLVALLLAYLVEPLVALLAARLRLNRPLVVGGLLCTMGLLLAAVLAIVIPLVVGQTIDFADDLRAGRFYDRAAALGDRYVPEDYRADYDRLLEFLRDPFGKESKPDAENEAAPEPESAGDREKTKTDSSGKPASSDEQMDPASAGEAQGSWLGLATGGLERVLGFLGAVVKLGFLLFLIPFYFFFFSVSFPAIVRFGHSLIPRHNKRRVQELLGKMDRTIAAFVRGRILISLIMGVMLAVGWWIVGVKYAVLIGMLIGVFSAVPYLGGIGIPVAIALLAFEQVGKPGSEQMAWWGVILWPTVVFAIVQVIETYFLTPVIAGKATNLDPVTIVVAVIAGGSIGGVYGMLLAIPVAACLKILLTDVLLPRIRAWTQGDAEDPLPIKRGDEG